MSKELAGHMNRSFGHLVKLNADESNRLLQLSVWLGKCTVWKEQVMPSCPVSPVDSQS